MSEGVEIESEGLEREGVESVGLVKNIERMLKES